MQRMSRIMVLAVVLGAMASPAAAQWGGNSGLDRGGRGGIGYDDAIDAAILSEISRDRQAERDARRAPYASRTGYGPIGSAREAANACGADALDEAGTGAKLLGVPSARTMSTGWEVEGAIDQGGRSISFVCSVRKGSVTGVLLR